MRPGLVLTRSLIAALLAPCAGAAADRGGEELRARSLELAGAAPCLVPGAVYRLIMTFSDHFELP